jgi:hypothetical protein
VNGDVHGDQASCGAATRASRFLTGPVTCFATHAVFDHLRRRTFPGGCFFASAALEMGTRPGPVKESVAAWREREAWARERQHEHERWIREDEARTSEHRREAYVDFYVAVEALARKAHGHGYGFTDEEDLPEGWQDDAAAKLRRLEFNADRPVAAAASAAYGAARSWGVYGKYDDPDDPDFYERQQKYDDAGS